MDLQTYLRKQKENTEELRKQEASESFDITKFHGYDYDRGVLPAVKLLKKVHDIFAAVRFGFLPYLGEHTGADAVMLENGIFIDVELKTCYSHISAATAFVTLAGTIYFTKDVSLWTDWVDENATSIAASQFKATFEIKRNLQSKNRKTFLICIDGNTGEYICVYSMEGNLVLEFLKTSGDIKLGSFISKGKEVTDFLLPVVGWQNWLDRSRNLLDIKRRSTTKKELARQLRDEQRLLKASLPKTRSRKKTKTDPNLQTSTLCSLESAQ